MPMKIPPYPGERVGDMIAEMGLTIVDAAKRPRHHATAAP